MKTYSIHLIDGNGNGAYLSVKGRTEWKTKRIAEKHASDIRSIISRKGSFGQSRAIFVDIEENH